MLVLVWWHWNGLLITELSPEYKVKLFSYTNIVNLNFNMPFKQNSSHQTNLLSIVLCVVWPHVVLAILQFCHPMNYDLGSNMIPYSDMLTNVQIFVLILHNYTYHRNFILICISYMYIYMSCTCMWVCLKFFFYWVVNP